MRYSRTTKVYSVQDAVGMARGLAGKVYAEFNPGLVVGVLRRGFLPAIEAANYLGVPYEFIRIKRDPSEVTHGIDNRAKIEGQSILLIDDVAVSVFTLEKGKEYLESLGAGAVKTAALQFVDLGGRKPDFFGILEGMQEKSIFPWDLWEDCNPAEHAGYKEYIRSMSASPGLKIVAEAHSLYA